MNSSGFSLIETIFAITVISISLAGFAQLMSTHTMNSVDPALRKQAHMIADAYMEEIFAKPFCDPDFNPDGDLATGCAVECAQSACSACGGPANPAGSEGTNRSSFDDICDYTGLPDKKVRDQFGNLITALDEYRVTVNIIDDSDADLDGLSAANGQSLRIDVQVTHATNTAFNVTLSGYRANF